MTIFYKEYRPRIVKIFCFILVVVTFIWGNLFNIHVLKKDFYTEKVNTKIISKQKLQGKRGLIFDRNGNYLARNIKAYTFIVDTYQKYDKEKILDLFSKTFNESRSEFEKLLSKKSRGVVLAKDIPLAKCQDIVRTNIFGLTKKYRTIRSYPYNELAAQVIGYTGKDNSGVNGVEKYFNSSLSGEAGSRTLVKTSKGVLVESIYDEKEAPIQGNDIALTLDMNLQCILEDELLQKVINTKATNANGVIVDPITGEILAMASVPSLDLNEYFKYNINYHQNRTIIDAYEPASTFKVLALAGLLEEGLVHENEKYDCENGSYKFYGKMLNDHEPHDILTTKEIIMHSSNIGISKIVNELDPGIIYKYARAFGFGNKTGVYLPSESNGLLRPLSTWNRSSGTFVSIGQEISSSTLQTAMAYSAIANGGYLVKPKIIKNIKNDNELIFDFSQKVIRQVISNETSKRLINILEAVVEEGTGKNAKINGFKVAGKTGTSQTYDNGKISDTKFISSFAGIFPSNEPKYVCVIAINNPQTYNSHWASNSAAPVVGNIFKRILNESKTITPFKPNNFVGVTNI